MIGEDHWKPPALVRLCAFAPTPVAHARLILSAFVAVIPVHVRRAVDAGNQRAAGSRFWFEYLWDVGPRPSKAHARGGSATSADPHGRRPPPPRSPVESQCNTVRVTRGPLGLRSMRSFGASRREARV